MVLGWEKQYPGAEAAWRRAGALYEGLAADFPEVPEYKDALATSLDGQAVTIGGLLDESLNPGLEKPPANATIQGRLREIEEIRERAVGIRQHLAERHTDVPEYEEQYLGSMLDLSRVRHLQENQEGARVLLEQALTRAEAFLKTHPDSLRGLMHARSALDYLAIVAIESGDHAAATRYAEGWARGQLEFYRRASHLKEWTDGDLASVVSDECENQLNRPDSLPRKGPLVSERMLAASVEASRLEFKALVQEATRHATDFPRTLYHLADALTTAPAEYRDPELALRFARRAVELKPEDGMCRQSLGWALLAGDLEGCIATLSEKDFMHCPFLAMAHWRLGDKDRAFELFDRADKGLPGYERRCEERLKQGRRSYPSPAVLRRVQAEATALLGVESSKDEARPKAAPDSAGPPA